MSYAMAYAVLILSQGVGHVWGGLAIMARPWVMDSAEWMASLITTEEAWARLTHKYLNLWEQLRYGAWMTAILKRMGYSGAEALEALHIFRRECYELERWRPR